MQKLGYDDARRFRRDNLVELDWRLNPVAKAS